MGRSGPGCLMAGDGYVSVSWAEALSTVAAGTAGPRGLLTIRVSRDSGRTWGRAVGHLQLRRSTAACHVEVAAVRVRAVRAGQPVARSAVERCLGLTGRRWKTRCE